MTAATVPRALDAFLQDDGLSRISMFEQAGAETERAEFKGWQDGFWEQNIFTEKFLKQKLDYIHMNPVRAGIASNAIDYPYSSARNYYLDDHHLIEIDSHWG